ncbi:MAG TPA: hypothetical protein VHY36_13455 [Steroidobacteraceae bacterium]|jgi:phage terminase Nu1 subunit (DNA packaging protein)|nr:hypothetical protein [Steroidobacteraceae bacterium]
MPQQFFTKAEIASLFKVDRRTVERWRARGLLPQPLKFGRTLQAPVRWSADDLVTLQRNIAALTPATTQREAA